MFSEVETLRGPGRPAECFGCRDVQESRGKIWLWPVGCGFSSPGQGIFVQPNGKGTQLFFSLDLAVYFSFILVAVIM